MGEKLIIKKFHRSNMQFPLRQYMHQFFFFCFRRRNDGLRGEMNFFNHIFDITAARIFLQQVLIRLRVVLVISFDIGFKTIRLFYFPGEYDIFDIELTETLRLLQTEKTRRKTGCRKTAAGFGRTGRDADQRNRDKHL